MKVCLAQVRTTADKNKNYEILKNKIWTAVKQQARLIIFPEASMQAFGTGRLDIQAEPNDGNFVQQLHTCAREHNIGVIFGMFSPADSVNRDGKTVNRVTNTLAVLLPDGRQFFYDKIHTYDSFNYRESDTVKPGKELVTFEYEDINFGLATCYDVRFPGQFRSLAHKGAEVIVLPASWAGGAGKYQQWQTLTSARALDSTCFIIAVDQAARGEEDTSAPTGIGYSALIDPTGVRLREAGAGEENLFVEIDPKVVEKTRKTLTVLLASDHYAS
ncbi:carbon-nitrogen hydrolase family protein [Corynebacterium kutscheri]|uniref:carbon-nitrogen hydrolase family protein n=1 Tax=Corynebacterium kutscheri TaxID=35755 RepID=UPI0037C0E835